MTEPMHHGSAILSWEKGKLLSCWFAGTRESAKDVQIFCTDSSDNGETWSKPRVVVKAGEKAKGSWGSNKTVGNCSLFRDEQGYTWLFYAAVVVGGWSGSHVDYKVSKDDGKTWSASQRLVGSYGNLPRNKALQLKDGKVLLPLYREFTSNYGYLYELKLKNGAIVSSETKTRYVPGTGHVQPTVVEKSDDIFYVYLRNKTPGKTMFATFDRKKNTWSTTAPIDVPNPDSALDSIGFHKGVLLVYNDSPSSRSPLSLGWSADGKKFKKVFDLEKDPKGGFAYPAITEDKAGNFHLTYTFSRQYIKYVRFNRAWLEERLP